MSVESSPPVAVDWVENVYPVVEAVALLATAETAEPAVAVAATRFSLAEADAALVAKAAAKEATVG